MSAFVMAVAVAFVSVTIEMTIDVAVFVGMVGIVVG